MNDIRERLLVQLPFTSHVRIDEIDSITDELPYSNPLLKMWEKVKVLDDIDTVLWTRCNQLCCK